MKTSAQHTITLTHKEVLEAVREYVTLHSCGERSIGENTAVYAVVDDDSFASFSIEAIWEE